MNSRDLFPPSRSLARIAWFVTLSIIYGQLVPFEFQSVPLAHAVAQFSHIGWKDLRIDDPVDWGSNVFVGLAFGFFACGALSQWRPVIGMILTALFGMALAAGTEFIQIWEPSRVGSIGDVAAQLCGLLAGISIWVVWGNRLLRTGRSLNAGGPQALRAALLLYVLFYCFMALFPFDFRFDFSEIRTHLADPNAIVFVPHRFVSGRGLLYLVLKATLLAPLGAVIRLAWHQGVVTAILAAFFLSALIEIAHWFEYSSQSQIVSIVGAVIGAGLGNRFADVLGFLETSGTKWLRRGAWLVFPFYAAALAVLRGLRFVHVARAQVEQTIANMNWLPFYYGWIVSEPQALTSTIGIGASFLPLGAMIWAARLRPGEPAGTPRSLVPGFAISFMISLALEIGRLVVAGYRPDPTNVLIAVAAAAISQRSCEWLARVLSEISFPVTT